MGYVQKSKLNPANENKMMKNLDSAAMKSVRLNPGESLSPTASLSYSVLMSVYAKESASHLSAALNSICTQTIPPEQVVLVEDGPLTPALEEIVCCFETEHPELFTVIRYETNQGLGYALAKGLPECRNAIVARMDSDDLARPDRIEKQLRVMFEQKLDMIGSQVIEFTDSPDNPITQTNLPLEYSSIQAYSKKRNPFRHPTMVFLRDRALQAGNYNSKYLYFEDWDLFNRMLANGCLAKNLDEPLVAMRVNSDFYSRRGGVKYLPYIWRFKVAQLKSGYFNFYDFISSTIPHMAVCMVPNRLRTFIYMRFLRKGIQ